VLRRHIRCRRGLPPPATRCRPSRRTALFEGAGSLIRIALHDFGRSMNTLTLDPEHQVNYLLDALPSHEWQALKSHVELVRLREQQILCDAGKHIEHAYFPLTGVVSLLYKMKGGASVEVAAVGPEGMIGVPILTGREAMSTCVQVQCPGIAYRITATELRKHFDRCDFLRRLMLLYMQALLMQVAQTAICNRDHSVYEQLCRWLLVEMDRMPTNEVHVSHQLIADMLGVRREGVTAAIGRLQDAGLVENGRRSIKVNDRAGLEAHACVCYGLVKREFDRLLPVHAREAVG
jgi:CRP-like cAMP-binding protein